MSDHESPEPDVPALTAWHEAHAYSTFTDRPDTRLWMPHEAPYAILQTLTRGGPHGDEYLPDPTRPMVNLKLGGRIDIGGYLDEIENYLDAARDAVKLARWQADTIAARMAEDVQQS